ncbi:MAG: hypothetical protein ACTHK7_13145, partial [Aureliella sp.]
MPLAQAASDYWLTKWASPFFLVGVGILAGLALLAVFLLLVKVLSAIPPWEGLSRSPFGHVVAAILTGAIAAGSWALVSRQGFAGAEQNLEKILVFMAVLLLSAIVGWALVFCAGRKSASNLMGTLSEGASSVLALVALVIMVVGLLAGLLFPNPLEAITSVPRLFETGTYEIPITIAGAPADLPAEESPLVPVDLDIKPELLQSLRIKSDRTVVLGDAPDSSQFTEAPRRLQADEEISWSRKENTPPPIPVGSPVPGGPERKLHIQNREIDPATIVITVATTPAVPEASTILITAAIVLLTGIAILLQQAVAPRASAIALATIKNELAQPLFAVLIAIGTFAIVLFVFLSFFT